MRLLQVVYSDTEDLELHFIEPDDDQIPPYAVLSHTWGADGEEYLYRDVTEGTGKDKPGYRKVLYCAVQAWVDGLQHIWVDTCCIDKSSSNEISEAINSMFKWYRSAARCYVYLSDVLPTLGLLECMPPQQDIDASLKNSRWFTRGWTLQELIAPPSAEFYSCNWRHLGDKRSLEKQIHGRTAIPISILRGESLDGFNIEERLAWTRGRKTRRQEDQVYSLLGIFGVHMPLLYGEGREAAFARLRREISMRAAQPLDTNVSNGLTPADQPRGWKPRYYFFYGWHTSQNSIVQSLRLTEPPVIHRAYIRGYSVASLGQWRVLLEGPTDGRAEGVAYKVESERHESKLILDETYEYVPGPCTISILTGDGWFEIEGRAFKYCGPDTGLESVIPGAKPFKDTSC